MVDISLVAKILNDTLTILDTSSGESRGRRRTESFLVNLEEKVKDVPSYVNPNKPEEEKPDETKPDETKPEEAKPKEKESIPSPNDAETKAPEAPATADNEPLPPIPPQDLENKEDKKKHKHHHNSHRASVGDRDSIDERPKDIDIPDKISTPKRSTSTRHKYEKLKTKQGDVCDLLKRAGKQQIKLMNRIDKMQDMLNRILYGEIPLDRTYIL